MDGRVVGGTPSPRVVCTSDLASDVAIPISILRMHHVLCMYLRYSVSMPPLRLAFDVMPRRLGIDS